MTAPTANNHTWYTNEGQATMSEHSNNGSWQQPPQQQYNWYTAPEQQTSWNWNQNQYVGHHQQQQYHTVPHHQPAMPNYSNMSQNHDPWNWGWEESGNTEQVNNNTSDPRWNWGVDSTQQYHHHQQQPPPPPLPPSSQQQQQSWSTVPPVQQSVINSSFNLTPHSNTSTFQVAKTDVISYSEPYSPASSLFNQDSYSQSQSSQLSFNSLNQSQSSLLTSQSQTDVNSSLNQGDESGPEPKSIDYSANDNIASTVVNTVRDDPNSSELEERKENIEHSTEVPYQAELRLENSTVEQDVVKSERLSSQWSTESLASQTVNKSSSSTGNNGLSSQWSTESLPSQGSDEIGQNERLPESQIVQNQPFLQVYNNDNPIDSATATLTTGLEEVKKEISSPTPTEIAEVENKEIISPEEKKNVLMKANNSYSVSKYKGQISPSMVESTVERKSFNQAGMASSVVNDLGSQFGALTLQPGYVESLDGMKRVSSSRRTEDGVNMETVPDNEERPDVVDIQVSSGVRNDMFCPVGQDAERDTGSQWLQQTNYSMSPENQEVAPRPDRNQYLETGQLNDDSIPDGLHRMVPGQNANRIQRMVPGQLNETAMAQDLDTNLVLETSVEDVRMVPGQLTEECDSNVNIGTVNVRSAADDIPPPGLRRMIPGESSSPESQGNSSVMLQPSANTFQPLPLEPRVVTGVAQDEMDAGGSTAVMQQPSSPSPVSRKTEAESPMPEQSSSSLPQPPSERSETIGSDGVDSFQPIVSDVTAIRDNSSRRDNVSKDRDRHRDDESEDDTQRRPESPSRYRDWNFDSRERYRMHDGHRSRQNASYERRDEDADTEDYYSDHDREKSRYRDYGGRYKGRDERERSHREAVDKSSRQDHHRSFRRDDRDRDSDHGRSRNSNRERKRSEYSDRHRDRYEYRHPEDYYNRSYDEYYRDRDRSRPSSRSEYEDYRRREYSEYSNYYGRQMNPYHYDPYYAYKFYENLRRTDPAAYAAWYAKYYSMPQNYNQETSYSGERGSVHSGRSSANEELNRDRYQRTGMYNAHDYYQMPEYEIGRSLNQNDSLTEEVASSTPQRFTPAKFSTAHVKGILTTRGQLIKVCPHYPLDGQPATVEIHDMQTLLGSHEMVLELQDFPGPLVRDSTHKTSVINFCQRKIKKAEKDPDLYDRESVILLWRFLVLFLKQNGAIAGTDMAELLLSNTNQNTNSQQTNPSPANSHHSIQDLQAEEISTNVEEITNHFREFLLYGNTKEALEWAMKNGLWGHALFLASKMDQRTYAQVMIRFANGLSLNDPLQTLYQMMSGRQPGAVTCCADEKWGDWKTHLAMILSNSLQRPELSRKAIMTLGDTLGARGCLHASHFCYLMANQEFGDYSHKSSKIVLIGSSHHKSFDEFATNEAIQMTEIYHYACQLDGKEEIPQFQMYKYLYALRLAELGMPAEAIHYVEVIAGCIVRQASNFGIDFIKNVLELGEKLKLQDPIYNSAEGMGIGMSDPIWLQELRNVLYKYESGQIQHNIPSYGSNSNLSYSEDSSQHMQPVTEHTKETSSVGNEWELQQQQLQQQQQQLQQQEYYYPSQQANWNTQTYQQPVGVAGDGHAVDTGSTGGQFWTPNTATLNQGEQTKPEDTSKSDYYVKPEEAKEPDSMNYNSATTDTQPSYNYWDNHVEGAAPRISLPNSSEKSTTRQEEETSPAQPKSSSGNKSQSKQSSSSSWWIGGIWSKLAPRPKNQMKLPDDKNPSIVWDPKKNKWVNVDGDEDEGSASLAPPPKASELVKTLPTENSAPVSDPSATSTNIYKLNGPAKKPKYVNVLGGSKSSNPVLPAPTDIFPNMTNSTPSMTYFVPEPLTSNENAPIDFLTPAVAPSSSEQQGKDVHLSRWSSTSSLSREVQKYTMRGQQNHAVQNSNYGAPVMFNPADFTAPTAGVTKKSAGLKRYAN